MPNWLARLGPKLKWPPFQPKRSSSLTSRGAHDDGAHPGSPPSDPVQPSEDVAAFARPIEPGKIDAVVATLPGPLQPSEEVAIPPTEPDKSKIDIVVATLPGPLQPSKEVATQPTEPDKSNIAVAACSDLVELSNEAHTPSKPTGPSKIGTVMGSVGTNIGQPVFDGVGSRTRLTFVQWWPSPSRARSRTRRKWR
jgi:hypothetical protein